METPPSLSSVSRLTPPSVPSPPVYFSIDQSLEGRVRSRILCCVYSTHLCSFCLRRVKYPYIIQTSPISSTSTGKSKDTHTHISPLSSPLRSPYKERDCSYLHMGCQVSIDLLPLLARFTFAIQYSNSSNIFNSNSSKVHALLVIRIVKDRFNLYLFNYLISLFKLWNGWYTGQFSCVLAYWPITDAIRQQASRVSRMQKLSSGLRFVQN